MDSTKISVIIPVYNTGRYLRKCLDSLCKQTLQDIEIIVVDDGSNDESPIICNEFKNNDSFKIIHKKNTGVSDTRNSGISKASGKYIMFVDSDDWLEPETCELMYNAAEKSKADFVITAHFNESSLGSKRRFMYPEDTLFLSFPTDLKGTSLSPTSGGGYVSEMQYNTLGLIGSKLKNPALLDQLTPIWARLYRRDIIKSYNLKFIDLKKLPSECLQFNFEYTFHAKSAFYLNIPLYHYRRNTVVSVTKIYRDNLLDKWFWWYEYMNKKFVPSFDNGYKQAFYSRLCCSVIPLGGNALKLKSYGKIRRECDIFLKSEMLKEAFNNFNYHQCPHYWRIFFLSAKRQWTDLFIVLTWAMRKILDMRKK